MTRRTIYIALILGISLLSSSCSQLPIPGDQAHESQFDIALEAPIEQELMPEELNIKNCLSSDDMVTTLAAQAAVRQQISISEQATIVETGSAIDVPDEIYAELKSQVESEFQPIFEEAIANAKNVELVIPGLKIHMYRLHWIERVYQSTISFSMNDQSCTASYVYTLDIPHIDGYTTTACTG
jgi:hypothetical protein